MRLCLTIAALSMLVAGAAVAAEPSPFIGAWHWNPSASVEVPGEPQPRDVVLDITRADPAGVAWRLTILDEKGEREVQSFNGPGDGKPVAVEGRSDGSTGAFTVTASEMDSVYAYPGGATDRSRCALSPDRKRMTCRGTESDGKGHAANYVDVYDRQ
jgi:hypothetical protein